MGFLGGRQLDAHQRLKRFVERERKLRKKEAEAEENINQKEISHNFSIVAFQVLRETIYSTSGKPRRPYYIYISSAHLLIPIKGSGVDPCLGRHLCHLGAYLNSSNTLSSMESLAFKTVSFALMWIQLEDRSQSFIKFLENVTNDDFDESLDCDLIFYTCPTS